MECEEVVLKEVAERYLRGALAEAELEAFERHYFECARCFGELETYRALRQALSQVPAARRPAAETRGRRLPWILAAAAAVVVGVGSGLYWSFVVSAGAQPEAREAESQLAQEPPPGPSRPAVEATPPVVAEVTVPTESRPTTQGAAALAALAVVQPPAYAPILLRGTLDEAARRFREAMQLYARGEYEGAKTGLHAAAGLDRERPDIAFFLGVCELLTDEPGAAQTELRRTIALGESPYLEEAHFHLAKAYLRQGELDAAASQLEETIRLRGEREQEARELLQKLETFRSSP